MEAKDLSVNVDSILKWIGVLSVGIWALGFVVLNSFLARFGLSDYTIFDAGKVRAGFAGIWPTIAISLAFFLIWFFAKIVKDSLVDVSNVKGARSPWPTLIGNGFFILGGLLGFIVLVNDIDRLLAAYVGFGVTEKIVAVGVLGLLVVVFPAYAVLLAFQSRQTARPSALARSIALIILAFFYFAYFGRSVYGDIPLIAFGGQPQQVQFAISSDYRNEPQLLGFQMSESNDLTTPVFLLHENNRAYFFAEDINGKGSQISRDLVVLIKVTD